MHSKINKQILPNLRVTVKIRNV